VFTYNTNRSYDVLTQQRKGKNLETHGEFHFEHGTTGHTFENMAKRFLKLAPDMVIHFRTHAVGSEFLFRADADYLFFVSKMKQYIQPIAKISSWSLLPTQVDITLHINSAEEINKQFQKLYRVSPQHEQQLARFISKQFGNLLNSYARSYNLKYNRTGALFIDFFRREVISTTTEHLKKILEVHTRCEVLGFVNRYYNWPYSSYRLYNEREIESPYHACILNLFGNSENFRLDHKIFLKNLRPRIPDPYQFQIVNNKDRMQS
jgi:putative transposase